MSPPGPTLSPAALRRTAATMQQRLLAAAESNGVWTGELASSALATAVAVVALARAGGDETRPAVQRGLAWLLADRHRDGGWGDSPTSAANLSTTLLAWSALAEGERAGLAAPAAAAPAQAWLQQRIGSDLTPSAIASAVLAFYGDDRTFSAPILSLAAVTGRLGDPARWDLVPQLPMELAAVPHRLLHWLRLPVVSYAIPALVAIGLVRHRCLPSANPAARLLRDRLSSRLLDLLAAIQPANGGYLEAAPLTGFVVMSLAAAGLAAHPVARAGKGFLLAAQRPDGSWPIDSNLATWLTTMAVNACAAGGDGISVIPERRRQQLRTWLLGQQLREEHAFTHAAPGGWAWTDLPGGVPDADDTAGALLALCHLDDGAARTRQAAARGLGWLIDLQNRDGGLPTFCRGWGRLPFDRSCPDITAHALRALAAWQPRCEPALQHRITQALARGISFLGRAQRHDGTWLPLWFGNQWAPQQENPVYGTAQVLLALTDPALGRLPAVRQMVAGGQAWLLAAQAGDGGWGWSQDGGATIEETALALAALAGLAASETSASLDRAAAWLAAQLTAEPLPAAPIGLYFASLWYAERLYPLIFSVNALNRLASRVARAAAA